MIRSIRPQLSISLMAAVVMAVGLRASPVVEPARRALIVLQHASRWLRPVDPSSIRTIDVILKVKHQAALVRYVAALSDPSSAAFHHYLSPQAFALDFGPDAATRSMVARTLTAQGLHLVATERDGLELRFRGSTGAIDRVFQTKERYRTTASSAAPFVEGTVAPLSPTAITGDVAAILGLNNSPLLANDLVFKRGAARQRVQGHRVRAKASGPRPCGAAKAVADTHGSLTADQLAKHYAISPLYGLHDLGKGQRIGVLEFEPYLQSDVSGYGACYGITPNVTNWAIDGGAGTGAGSGEAALDIEDVMGLAPDAAVDVYEAPNTAAAFYDALSAIANGTSGKGPIDQIGEDSWGACESLTDASDPGFATAIQGLFAQMAVQGQVMFASAGDSGSEDCLPDTSALGVDDPASQPNVIGVGGTSITSNTDVVWNNQYGAGGGGLSSDFCMPSYQDTAMSGIISNFSVSDPSICGTTVPYRREVPDVSADADPATGYVISYNGQWQTVGGTSAAAPLWAAVAALTDASPFCQAYGSLAGAESALQPGGLYDAMGKLGFLSRAFSDVTFGDNDATGTNGGDYPATVGYDLASGMGTPIVVGVNSKLSPSLSRPGLAALMCHFYAKRNASAVIHTLSKRRARAETRLHLTIHGTGFLPIPGADTLLIGASRTVTASCTSTTVCTASLPKLAAGTYRLRMNVEELSTSANSVASTLTLARMG